MKFRADLYVYLAASNRFRQIVRGRFFVCGNKPNEIHPINTVLAPHPSSIQRKSLAIKAPMHPSIPAN
jgi:hypothetical protein